MSSPSITVHPRPAPPPSSGAGGAKPTSTTSLQPANTAAAAAVTGASSPLPHLLHTPSGLALMELQGTLNLPEGGHHDDDDDDGSPSKRAVAVGRLDFPDYRGPDDVTGSTAWMKRVYMLVGQHQRLAGSVQKLPKPLAIVRRRRRRRSGDGRRGGREEEEEDDDDKIEELEVVDIVKYKIVFSNRPEPVNTTPAGGAPLDG